MFNRLINTWNGQVDQYIVLNNFSKKIFIQGGIDSNLITVKPNFINDDPGFSTSSGNYFFYAGRLEKNKGVELLYQTFSSLQSDLKIAGSGDLYPDKEYPNILFLGQVSKSKILDLIKDSIAIIYPTFLYENMPMLILEAFACGKCVIATNIGAVREMIQDGFNGLLFNAGDKNHLTEKIKWVLEHPSEVKIICENARLSYERYYSSESNYNELMKVYLKCINLKSNGKN